MVETNFKNTEIGPIPEDWDLKELHTISTLKGRIGWQGLKQEEFTDNDSEPFLITGVNFKDGKIKWNEVYHVSLDRYNIAKEIQLKVEDVLMTKDGTIGKILFVDHIPSPFMATLNSHLLLYRPKNNLYIPKYLYYNLHSNYFLKYIEENKSGSTFFGISQSAVSQYKVVVPPIDEQQAIATALSDADAWIESLEKLIAKKRLIKQGAMQRLLTPKDDWEVKRLGNIGKTYGGLSGKSKIDFQNGKCAYITFLNVMRNTIIDTNLLDYVNIKKGEIQNKVFKEDLIFNGSSETPEELGLCAVLLEEVSNLYLNSFCFGFRLFDDSINSLFLVYLFRSQYGRELMFHLAQGATRYNLSKSNFLNLEVSAPKTKDEQIRIANILIDMDAEIEALEQKLQKAHQIKQGMMQQLLTGKIRLIKNTAAQPKEIVTAS